MPELINPETEEINLNYEIQPLTNNYEIPTINSDNRMIKQYIKEIHIELDKYHALPLDSFDVMCNINNKYYFPERIEKIKIDLEKDKNISFFKKLLNKFIK